MHLPHDMFQLFLLTGVIGERLGDALGVMHLVAFTLLTTTVFLGRLSFRPAPLLRYVSLVALIAAAILIGTRATLWHATWACRSSLFASLAKPWLSNSPKTTSM